MGGWGVARGGPSRVSQRGSERRCSAIVSGGAARSRLELSHAPTSTSIHLPASASDRFLVWTIRPGCLPPPLPALNPINNAVGSRLRVTAILPARFPRRVWSRGFREALPRRGASRQEPPDPERIFVYRAAPLTGQRRECDAYGCRVKNAPRPKFSGERERASTLVPSPTERDSRKGRC